MVENGGASKQGVQYGRKKKEVVLKGLKRGARGQIRDEEPGGLWQGSRSG